MSLNVIRSRNFGKDSFMHYYCKTHNSLPSLLTLLFVSLSVIQELFVFLFYRGWDRIPCRQPGSELTGQEITDPSEHSSLLFPALSPTHQNLWVFISQLPDVHLLGIVLNFTALSCLQSSRGTQWPCVCLRPGRRHVSMTRSHASIPGPGGSTFAVTVDPQPCRLDVSGELKENWSWCWRSGFLSWCCHLWSLSPSVLICKMGP